MDGGRLTAGLLAKRGVRFIFTLCGGHISPILVGAKGAGIRVIDVRDEVTAVFAADAVSRLTGAPGVAVVTAGPGVTNTITALKNAQLAQSPLVLLGGATATILRGRGSLQDIDQMALVGPHVKWKGRATRLRDVVPLLTHAFDAAMEGTPGPVFLELPLDVLYPEEVVRSFYGVDRESGGGLAGALRSWYLRRHLARLFAPFDETLQHDPPSSDSPREDAAGGSDLGRVLALWERAAQPVIVAGSQVVARVSEARHVAAALERLGAPVYLSGMARGLLGTAHPLHMRHRRREALREADLVVLAGVPCDFRLDYGRHIPRRTPLVSLNISKRDLRWNRHPTAGVIGDPGALLRALADRRPRAGAGGEWVERLRARDDERETTIDESAASSPAGEGLDPLALCKGIDTALDDDSIIVADGGDFVGTASYIVRPRGPLSWLDPGPFGTLGVGAGFALGAKLCRPDAEVWILYGDGSSAYSLMELDTFARHGLPVIAVVGNDARWMQIVREQVALFDDDVATVLARNDYHTVAEGWGARGLLLDAPGRAGDVLAEAKRIAASGAPVLVNAHLAESDFRKGSLSV